MQSAGSLQSPPIRPPRPAPPVAVPGASSLRGNAPPTLDDILRRFNSPAPASPTPPLIPELNLAPDFSAKRASIAAALARPQASRKSLLFDPVLLPRFRFPPAGSLAPDSRIPPRHLHSSSQSPLQDHEAKRLKRRAHLIRELVDTEISFCQDLELIETVYKLGASDCKPLKQEDSEILFANSSKILQFSRSLLQQLQPQDHSTEPDILTLNIGFIFGKNMMDIEKVYSKYCKHHEQSIERLHKLKANEDVRKWLEMCQANSAGRTTAWDLDSLLIKPVQRVLKYPLLLMQILEITHISHSDYVALDLAAKEITLVADRINEIKKRKDIVDKVVGRRKTEADFRRGLHKSLSRRAEKIRQTVGLSQAHQDPVYLALSLRFTAQIDRLQNLIRNIESWISSLKDHLEQVVAFSIVLDEWVNLSPLNDRKMRSRWKSFRIIVDDMVTTQLSSLGESVHNDVLAPLEVLYSLHEVPAHVISKHDIKFLDHNRAKAFRGRGEVADKILEASSEDYLALHASLLDELPKFFALSRRMVDVSITEFAMAQAKWYCGWADRLKDVFPDGRGAKFVLKEISEHFHREYNIATQQMNELDLFNKPQLTAPLFASPLTPAPSISTDDEERRFFRLRMRPSESRERQQIREDLVDYPKLCSISNLTPRLSPYSAHKPPRCANSEATTSYSSISQDCLNSSTSTWASQSSLFQATCTTKHTGNPILDRGFPHLSFTTGEVFDIYARSGDGFLLARIADSEQVGWIPECDCVILSNSQVN
ncbi:Dynamin-binding protein [Neolecta irregularis DAH-3]|uniref:Dynamin-binding protein n=1 Tax=Neolecta irregularis (strain DAH-3) TaxID=1198029 RepID=A0A1U7LW96_NEOID|nr:Dynamin-binding protein [Neolecta irregularis DAH-3]|eukprot:OLL26843.1 Dynamin-binding protein [Neolecta irregularis DAH-3]